MSREVVEEYDEDGDLVCVLCEDAQENLWIFTKGIYQARKHDTIPIIATGKWQTLNTSTGMCMCRAPTR
jgi:hypothetical protein